MTTACGAHYWAVDIGGGVWKFRIYRSADDFATYDTIYTPVCSRFSRTQAICADAANPTNWVLGAYHSTNPYSGPQLFYSADDGLTWNTSDYSGGQGITSIATDNHGRWFAVTDAFDTSLTGYSKDINVPPKILKSVDDGATWSEVRTLSDTTILGYWSGGARKYAGALQQSLATDGAGTWALSIGADIFKSADHGATWSKVYTHPGAGTDYMSAQGMATDGSGNWLATITDETASNILRSTDNGATWSSIYAFPSSSYWDHLNFGLVQTDKAGVWIVGANWCGDDTLDNVYRSTNNGTTWSPVYRFTVMNVIVEAITADANRHWLASDFTVVNSDDLGATFTPVLEDEHVTALAYSGLLPCPPPEVHPGGGVVFV